MRKQYEQASGDDSYRMLIPRALKAIYNVRNKRGVGHLNNFSANEMDATYIMYTTEWVLAELVRLSSHLPVQETQELVDDIVERQVKLLWKSNGIVRVLETGLSAKKKILVLLYDQSPRSEESLRSIIEYKNKAKFRSLLGKLHRERLIEHKEDENCVITPKGSVEAETIINRNHHKR